MKNAKLKQVLQLHEKWLGDSDTGRQADLRDANLCYVNLRDADLRYANLRGAGLRDVSLRGVIGEGKRIKTVQDKWYIVYTEDVMAIGCQQHTLKDWFSFSDDQISRMHVDALQWWKKHKPILKVLTDFEE